MELNLYYLKIIDAFVLFEVVVIQVLVLADAGCFQKQHFRLPAKSRYQ